MRFTMKSSAAAAALLVAATRALEIRSGGEEPNNMAFPSLSKALDAPESLRLPGSSKSSGSIQEEIQQMQAMHSIRLEREKEVYAKKLKDQESANTAMTAENAQLTKDIQEVKGTNAKLLRNADLLQKDISVRRQEVALLTEQLKNSVNLMTDSYSQSDVSNLKELDVLREPGLASTDAEKSKFTALLAISQVGEGDDILHSISQDIVKDVSSSSNEDAAVQEAIAAADAQEKSVVANLLAGVQEMRKKGKEREEQLKADFLSRKAALDKIHKAVAAQNAELKATLKVQKTYATRLIAAMKKMQEVKAHLDTQLRDGGLFMKRLGDVAERKPKVAVKQLEAVSKMVGKKSA
eukprot:TRINITY_DN32077_c0_g1_i1.p1 TRINITY_DN32077_c0_g1~~TRINITY_DN32077_c0_g1_i1.p1  ORF type:complete len:351 (+),score=112.60 TRINITY_DN32077_c0_g1_i1:66-1118(+)